MWVLQACKWCGRTHLIWRQEKMMSCGIACMMMAIQRTNKLYAAKARLHKKFPMLKKIHDSQAKPSPHPTEDEMRVASRYHLGGYRPAPSDIGGVTETTAMNNLVNELKGLNKGWTHTGITGLANVAATLNSLGVPAKFKRVGSVQAAMNALTDARWGKPIVAGVRWNGGGEHAIFVDCAKPLKPSKKPPKPGKLLQPKKSPVQGKAKLTWRVCICDPDGSLVHVDIPPNTTVYYPGGRFTKEFVYIG
jgi:hypothetical protein